MTVTSVFGFYGEMIMVQMVKLLPSVAALVDVHSLEAIEMDHAFLSHPVKMHQKESILPPSGAENGNK